MPESLNQGVVVRDIAKRYRKGGAVVPALTHVSFTVGRGEILGLLGVNGAGKSTLVRILSTLLKPDTGTVSIAGYDILKEPDAVRQSIGIAQQEVGLDDQRSVQSVLHLHAQLHGLSRGEGARRIEELLECLGLQDVVDRRIRDLSGGMRRKTDLALALVHSPQIIFLDEPTSGLDPPSRIGIWNQLRELRTKGVTILLTTQHLEEADALADKVIILSEGRIVSEGPPAALKKAINESVLELDFEDPSEATLGADRLGEASRLLEQTVYLPISGPADLRSGLELLNAHGIHPIAVRLKEPSLDEFFLSTDQPPQMASPSR
jgi:ABC-2 type transport system ATP-binding protein